MFNIYRAHQGNDEAISIIAEGIASYLEALNIADAAMVPYYVITKDSFEEYNKAANRMARNAARLSENYDYTQGGWAFA